MLLLPLLNDARGKLLRAGGTLAAAVVLVAAILASGRFYNAGRFGPREHYEAHARSAHARVACAVCHRKTAGNRPPAQVCLACHSERRAVEDRLRVVERFAADEHNSATRTAILLRMSARRRRRGIHGAHLRRGVSILYTAAGAKRQSIFRVEVRHAAGGRSEVYEDATAGPPPGGARTYVMDCVDCHNRTAHAFEPPSRALDRLMSAETLSPSLRFIKRAGLELLLARYPDREEARAGIRARLARFYRERDPQAFEKRRAEIGGAAEVLASVYQPAWARYPDNLGHTQFPGCFRCHAGRHTSAGGAAIASDCESCHRLFPYPGE